MAKTRAHLREKELEIGKKIKEERHFVRYFYSYQQATTTLLVSQLCGGTVQQVRFRHS